MCSGSIGTTASVRHGILIGLCRTCGRYVVDSGKLTLLDACISLQRMFMLPLQFLSSFAYKNVAVWAPGGVCLLGWAVVVNLDEVQSQYHVIEWQRTLILCWVQTQHGWAAPAGCRS